MCDLPLHRLNTTLKLLLTILTALAFASCAKPKPTLVVCVGGLGLSQLRDLRHAVIEKCPNADVVNAGGWDGYKSDLDKIVREKPHQHVVFIGHSFGCEAIASAATHLSNVALEVYIDPAWSDFKLPNTIQTYLWFKRSDFGLEREAKILGASSPHVIHGGHNDIPHSTELINNVIYAINQIKGSANYKPRQTASAR